MMSSKRPKKQQTFGNGDGRKATGGCRSDAQRRTAINRGINSRGKKKKK
jgi:hypothetical protein